MNDLFGKKPRRSPRKMMHMIDCGPGDPNVGKFECKKCGFVSQWLFEVTNKELKHGIPCQMCNPETNDR